MLWNGLKYFPKKTSSNKYFTLLETVIIFLIIGILSMVGYLRFKDFFYIKFQGVVKKLAEDIKYVRQFAIGRHTLAVIFFDKDQKIYWGCFCNTTEENCSLINCPNTTWPYITDPFTQKDLIVSFLDDNLYKGIEIDEINFSGNNYLLFNWKGEPQNSGYVKLSYQNVSFKINIENNTGLVKIIP